MNRHNKIVINQHTHDYFLPGLNLVCNECSNNMIVCILFFFSVLYPYKFLAYFIVVCIIKILRIHMMMTIFVVLCSHKYTIFTFHS